MKRLGILLFLGMMVTSLGVNSQMKKVMSKPIKLTHKTRFESTALMQKWLSRDVKGAPELAKEIEIPVIASGMLFSKVYLGDGKGTIELKVDDSGKGISFNSKVRSLCRGKENSCRLWLRGVWNKELMPQLSMSRLDAERTPILYSDVRLREETKLWVLHLAPGK